jgi:glycine dehydrogenase subunit 2
MGLQQVNLLFESSTPGARAIDVPASDVPAVEMDPAHSSYTETGLPEISQSRLVRHYTLLARRNFCADANFTPLAGSTLKYAPKVNDWAAALEGFAGLHPFQRDEDCQGALALLYGLRMMLQEIAGLDEVSLQPCAGSQAQWTALKVFRAWFHDRGDANRNVVLVPQTAHGTLPASAAMAGFDVVTLPMGADGLIDLGVLAEHLTDRVAALMMAWPGHIGKFGSRVLEIADLVHKAGALLYIDGASLNGAMGIARPGDLGADATHFNAHNTFAAPHGGGGPGAAPLAVRGELAPYLPVPQIVRIIPATGTPSSDGDCSADKTIRYALDFDRPKSIGNVAMFWGQFGILVRAYAYLRACGAGGLRHVSQSAVLAANYLAQRIKDVYPLPFGPGPGEPMAANPCAQQFVTVPRALLAHGISVIDIAKALIDRGFYPPAVHWPVPDCLVIEPTETEDKASLDALADALLEIGKLAESNPDAIRAAPTTQSVRRLDEIGAARRRVFAWLPTDRAS